MLIFDTMYVCASNFPKTILSEFYSWYTNYLDNDITECELNDDEEYNLKI